MANQWDDFVRIFKPTLQADVPDDLTFSTKQYVPNNSNLNFEKRILSPSSYPSLPDVDGSRATHKMAWDDANNNYVAFPTIIQTKAGNLMDLKDGAYDHAMRTGEYRKFLTAKEAEEYARGGYKNQWGANEWSILQQFGNMSK